MHLEIRGLEKLSFRERQVVALKEMGRRNEDIARILKISSSTVATLLNRARGKGYEVVMVIPGQALGVYEVDDEDQAD